VALGRCAPSGPRSLTPVVRQTRDAFTSTGGPFKLKYGLTENATDAPSVAFEAWSDEPDFVREPRTSPVQYCTTSLWDLTGRPTPLTVSNPM
jgi:hypothetical protein